MSGFNDPIIGGDGDLIRDRMRSPNYVAGVSGWDLEQDGSAEFNDLTARGNVLIGTPTAAEITANVPALIIDHYAAFSIPIGAILSLFPGDGSYHYSVAGQFDATTDLWAEGFVSPNGIVTEFWNHLNDTLGGSGQINFSDGPAVVDVQFQGGTVTLFPGVPLIAQDDVTIAGLATFTGAVVDANGIPFSRAQAGTVGVSFTSGGPTNMMVNVTYADPFPATPSVFLQAVSAAGAAVKWEGVVQSSSNTGFSARIDIAATANVTLQINWAATARTQ
jgi:hypothetical protein